jgi:uncharacterized protein (DUF488 family)
VRKTNPAAEKATVAEAIFNSDTPIFTIGHSTHPVEAFTDLLLRNRIGYVIDVRSAPYSRRMPQFNREPLSAWLRRHSIQYAHMPEEFGARRTDPTLLDSAQRVDFDRVRDRPEFRRGVERLKRGVGHGHRIALMCAEADPFDCHRFSMISYQLVREGIQVQHILRDGSVIDNVELEERLRQEYGLTGQTDLFDTGTSPALQLEDAYRQRGREVAYTAKEEEP